MTVDKESLLSRIAPKCSIIDICDDRQRVGGTRNKTGCSIIGTHRGGRRVSDHRNNARYSIIGRGGQYACIIWNKRTTDMFQADPLKGVC